MPKRILDSRRRHSRLIRGSLIIIGQVLAIPNIKTVENLGDQALKEIEYRQREKRRQHAQQGGEEFRQIRRLEQDQPSPRGGAEPMARRHAKKIAAPAYEVDLGKLNLAETKGPGFTLKAQLSGTLLLQDPALSTLDIKAKSLEQLEISSKHKAETAVGQLISDLKFELDPKTRTVKLSGGIASRSNIANAPLISMNTSLNHLGQPVLKGSVTYDQIKGKMDGHTFVGEKVAFSVEVVLEKDKQIQDSESALEDLAMTVGAVVIVVGLVSLVSLNKVENVVSLGSGVVDDPIVYAIAAHMTLVSKQLFQRYTVNLYRRVSRRFVTTMGVTTATPIAMAKSDLQ